MYAMVEINGKQYKAEEGRLLKVERLSESEGNAVEFDSVLMLRDDKKVKVGNPYVSGAKVKAVVEGHDRDKKVVVYKYKKRKRYSRKQGHRQPFSNASSTGDLREQVIRIALRVARNGCLQSLESSGHASDGSGEAGRNVACAGVSALLRSAGRLLAEQPGVRVEGSAEEPGFLQLRLTRIARRKRRYVAGVTGVLLQGLYDIRDDYPGELEIRELSEGE